MSQPNEPLVYASPRDVALKIAALHGGKPDFIPVDMIGTDDVERFVRELQSQQEKAHTVSLSLD